MQRERMTTAYSTEEQDVACIKGICNGHVDSFEALYKAYWTRLFRFIQHTLGRPDGVEELIHETFLVIWQRPDGFDFSCKVSTWIFGIAYNKALKAIAVHRREGQAVDYEDLTDELACDRASPEREAEARDWLNATLDVLSPEQRAVVELTFLEGLSYGEIAEIQGCPENTVKTRMFHARRKIQQLHDQVS